MHDAPSPQRGPRRLPRFSQAEIARAFRAAQQVGNEFGVRVEPDGAIAICRLAPPSTATAINPVAAEKAWRL
jgi:hypothetical protein